jgi:hypothetical protein
MRPHIAQVGLFHAHVLRESDSRPKVRVAGAVVMAGAPLGLVEEVAVFLEECANLFKVLKGSNVVVTFLGQVRED